MIVYKKLIPLKDYFSGSDAIIYSTLVSHSLWEYAEVFDGQGNFDICRAEEYIKCCEIDNGNTYIDLAYFTCQTLSDTTSISLRNVKYSLKHLKELNMIKGNTIYCPLSLLEGGYIKIAKEANLKGWQLIFYSMIKNKSDYFGGQINTWGYKLAQDFSTTIGNVYKMINVLKNKGYVRRLKNGNLRVL